MRRLQRAEEVTEGPYELKELQAPVLRGFGLTAFVNLFEGSVGDLLYPGLAQKSGVTQVLHELHVPDDPLYRADVSPINPDTPEPEAEALPPPPPQPAAGTAPDAAAATAAAAICGAIKHALATGLLPHEQQLAASAPAPAPAVEGSAVAAAATAAAVAAAPADGPLPPRPFTGSATVVDYVRAYRSGATTPTEVAERIIAFVEAGGGASGPGGGRRAAAAAGAPHVGWFAPGGWRPEQIRKEAEESTHRLREGRARSLLEGVPFAVKDAADALPYPTTCGTTFVAAERTPTADAPCVAALRALGCVLLGKTSMHEIGLGITGLNVGSKATAINPFSPGLAAPAAAAAAGADGAKPASSPSGSSGSKHLHYTGGSSSGTAAVLAAGVCPIAIGSDGGGSIRIPSAFCGLAGLKPTNGRVGGLHCVHVDCTVATLGPMAGCVQDVALMYAAMCGAAQWADAGLPPRSPGLLPEEPLPVLLPSPWPRLQPQAGAGAAGGGQKGPLAGLRIGVYDKWFDDAAPTVVAACRAALAAAERCGAQVVAVCVPDLEPLRVAHTVTIVSEMAQNFRERATNPRLRSAFNPESRLALANSRFWNSADYIQAQRIRARANVHFRRVLSQVHVLATPTTPIPSPRIHPAALTGGESNLQQVSRVMRFIVAPNMIGLPALSLPVGLVPAEEDRTAAAGPSSGAVMLPAGLQLMGRPQEEATLLRVGAVLEAELAKAGVTAGAAPPVHINPLTGERRGL
ncbi:hypothetical protein CHLRE_02g103350v5 [Chlamydomonas reinhardtii]|uniref:Amidase domain-containing protein n=1 Tax=Chlamydomonas reinhardtii TaxID=3055 RepID=A0A2K3E2G1_CHLRE|nr:uncharacterized protein CHLRE_02g103350v5 [Chlamydomonas reinhardtii]PNW86966.1 hypothetical protein CHLRE_02g103350v5 [Chlamydomonas reinhardtii]